MFLPQVKMFKVKMLPSTCMAKGCCPGSTDTLTLGCMHSPRCPHSPLSPMRHATAKFGSGRGSFLLLKESAERSKSLCPPKHRHAHKLLCLQRKQCCPQMGQACSMCILNTCTQCPVVKSIVFGVAQACV